MENLYSVLYNDKFAFDFSDPYRTSLGNSDLKQTRKSLIYSCFNLKSESIKKLQEDLVKYKPFTINEMIGDKVQITEKIEEMHELSSRTNTIYGNINILHNNNDINMANVKKQHKKQKYNSNSVKFIS